MTEQDWLAGQFEQSRPHLLAVAYSMLGTVSEAQDAVQEAWLRLDLSDPGTIGDLRGWLTSVVGRISLDMLRARKARHENYPGSRLPEPLVGDSADDGPEYQAVLADSVSLACSWCWKLSAPPYGSRSSCTMSSRDTVALSDRMIIRQEDSSSATLP